VLNGEIPDMTRMVIGVDPSGAKDEASDGDAIGIVVGGIGTDGNAYLLEDCTIKAGPAVWGKVAASAFDRHRADVIACEKNYGGEMARFTIQTARANTPVKMVNATRGKVVRAEPFSSLYEQGKIRHVGYFHEMEDELISFSQNGYLGQGSPNRADAWIWVLTELFPGMVRSDAKPENKIMSINVGRFPASR
jgi:phage terminase large subunit-like protein